MADGDIHTLPLGAEWINQAEGGEGVIGSPHRSRAEAERVGRQLADERRVEHVVHDADERIASRDDFRPQG
jgi:hypothetical protein